MGWSEIDVGCLHHFTPYFFRQGLSLNLELSGWLDWLAVSSRMSACPFPCPLSAKVMEVSQHTQLLHGSWESRLRPSMIGCGWCSQKEAGERRHALGSPGCSISEHIILRECGVQVPNQAVLEIC